MENGYRFIEHTADIGVEIWSLNLEGVYEIAGSALFDLIVPELGRPDLVRHLEIDGEDPATLLVNLLNELLYLFEVEGLIFREFVVLELGDEKLSIRVQCEKYDSDKTDVRTVVKAATWHMVTVEEIDGGWHGVIYLDL